MDSTEDAFETPDDAARGDIPERYSRALSIDVSPDGDEAIVLLGTNEPPDLYPYQVFCRREAAGWVAGDSSNMEFANTVWDKAPAGTAAAQVRVAGQELEVPVVDGYFQAVDWERGKRPKVLGFR